MKGDRLARQITHATRAVGKTYDFDHGHDNQRPIDFWFQETYEGLVLFVVFYTMACRYSACIGCNLPATSSLKHVDFRDIMKQIDHLFDDQKIIDKLDRVRKVIVSNQGSVLDEETLSSTALMYLIAKINMHVLQLSVLSLETRPEYIDSAELEFLARAIKEAHSDGATVEIAIGFEIFDEDLRNRVFRKGLSFEAFERVVELVSHHGFRLKCYFMQKPVPGMTDDQGIADIHAGIAYLDKMARQYGVPINMHLNPTYVAHGTPLEEAFNAGTFAAPRLSDVAKAALR
ncbi:MAG: hypothetical protein V3T05_14560, partial [Myxococcota bacterium]